MDARKTFLKKNDTANQQQRLRQRIHFGRRSATYLLSLPLVKLSGQHLLRGIAPGVQKLLRKSRLELVKFMAWSAAAMHEELHVEFTPVRSDDTSANGPRSDDKAYSSSP